MAIHTLTVPNASQPSLPNQPFFSWLRTHTTLFVGQIFGLLSVVSFITALIYYSKHASDLFTSLQPATIVRTVQHLAIYAHLPFLVVFIAVLIHLLDNNSRGRYRAGLVYKKLNGKCEGKDLETLENYSEEQVGRFKRRFLGFWCTMLLLYIAFAIESISTPQEHTFGNWGVISSFPFLIFALNNLSLVFVFWCFVVLYLPADATPPDSAPSNARAADLTLPALNKSAANAKATENKAPDDKLPDQVGSDEKKTPALSFLQKLNGVHLEDLERRQRNMIALFVVSVVILTLSFPAIARFNGVNAKTLSEYSAVFNALSGAVNAVVLALLIARLDSKLIALPSWLICVLYFYAGVQPLFVVFEIRPDIYAGIKTGVFIVVFIFKIYFFLIIIYSLQTGRMFNYFFCSRILNDHIRALKTQRSQAVPTAKPAVAVAEASPAERPADAPSDDLPLADKTQTGKPVSSWRLLLSGVLGALAMLYFVGSLIYYETRFGNENLHIGSSKLTLFIIVLHWVLLFVITFVAARGWYKARNRREDLMPGDQSEFKKLSIARFAKLLDPGFRTSSEPEFESVLTQSQFQSLSGYLVLFWISLLLLYVAMFFVSYKGSLLGNPWDALIFFVLNNITVLFVFWCFRILYFPGDVRKFADKHRLLRNYSLLLFVLLTVLALLLAIFIKSHASAMTADEKIPTIFASVGGTLNAVAFALLIARLDSRIIGLPSWLITVLYGYAALQPLFVAFNQPSISSLRVIATSAIVAAFLFKLCLVLILSHVKRSRGGVSDYLWFFPVLHNKVNSVFDNQFEIKAYSPKPGWFTYSIFNNNVEMYRAAEMCTTRAQCDDAIIALVDAMEKRENYSKEPQKIQGTHWVQVKLGTRLICESIGLRSQTEVDELINESIEKVPSCKYDRG